MIRIYGRLAWIGLILLLVAGCSQTSAADIQPVTAQQADELIQANNGNPDFIILDLRTPREFDQGHIAGARLIDYYNPQFTQRLKELDRSKTYLIYCRTGNRSGRTMNMIADMGFGKIYHLKAGIVEWAARKLPLVK